MRRKQHRSGSSEYTELLTVTFFHFAVEKNSSLGENIDQMFLRIYLLPHLDLRYKETILYPNAFAWRKHLK